MAIKKKAKRNKKKKKFYIRKEKELAEREPHIKKLDLYGEEYIEILKKDPLAEAKEYASLFNHLTLKNKKYSPGLYDALVSLYLKTSNYIFFFN